MATTAITNPLVVLDVKTFMQANGYISVHNQVRINSSNYPYVTFINGKNEAENIYFSKEAAKLVSKDQDIVKGFFNAFKIAETTNANNEKRIKLVREGASTRATLDDLF